MGRALARAFDGMVREGSLKTSEAGEPRLSLVFRLPFAMGEGLSGAIGRGRDGGATAKVPRAGTPRCAA
ncbi:hypothetical protein [Kingella oralis]|uniref:hypothetical protein n=1 Tax=Kingella oralis TaxID=505 RepID=UPI0034E5C6C1